MMRSLFLRAILSAGMIIAMGVASSGEARELFPGTWVSTGGKSGIAVVNLREPEDATVHILSDNRNVRHELKSFVSIADISLSSSGRRVYIGGVSKANGCTTLQAIDLSDSGSKTTEIICLPGKGCIEKLIPLFGDGVGVIDSAGNVSLIDASMKVKTTCEFKASRGTKGGGLSSLVNSPDGKWLAAVKLSGAIRELSDMDFLLLCSADTSAIFSEPLPHDWDGASLLWTSANKLLEISKAHACQYDIKRKECVPMQGSNGMDFDEWLPGPSGLLFAASRRKAAVYSLTSKQIKQQAKVHDKKYHYLPSVAGIVRLSKPGDGYLLAEWLSLDLKHVTKQQRISLSD